MTSSPSHFPRLQFFRHLFLTTKVSSNTTQVLECSPIQVLFLREISPSPVHCPFWDFAMASLKLHVVLLNCLAQKVKLFRVRRALALATTLSRVFTEHFACAIIRIHVKAVSACSARGRFRRCRVGLSRAISGGCTAKPTACTAVLSQIRVRDPRTPVGTVPVWYVVDKFVRGGSLKIPLKWRLDIVSPACARHRLCPLRWSQSQRQAAVVAVAAECWGASLDSPCFALSWFCAPL